MAVKQPPSTIAQVKDVFTKLGEISDKVVFGDVWERKQLSKRDRSLITIASNCALPPRPAARAPAPRVRQRGDQGGNHRGHHALALTGWPNGGSAALVAKEVFKERGV